jgi:hypothetical protein
MRYFGLNGLCKNTHQAIDIVSNTATPTNLVSAALLILAAESPAAIHPHLPIIPIQQYQHCQNTLGSQQNRRENNSTAKAVAIVLITAICYHITRYVAGRHNRPFVVTGNTVKIQKKLPFGTIVNRNL